MPIRITIETKNEAFPDTGSAGQYLAAVAFPLKQIDDAIKEFATHRIDRKIDLKDGDGQPCGEIEILRY